MAVNKKPPLAWVITIIGVIALGLSWYFIGPKPWLYYTSLGIIGLALLGLLVYILGAFRK